MPQNAFLTSFPGTRVLGPHCGASGRFLTLPFQTGARAVSEAISAKDLLDTSQRTPNGVARAKPPVAKPRLTSSFGSCRNGILTCLPPIGPARERVGGASRWTHVPL